MNRSISPPRVRHFSAVLFCLIFLCLVGAHPTGCAFIAPPPSPEPNDGFFDDEDQSRVIAREIEEADIVKLVDGFLYVANPFTGLRIIDAQAIDEPALRGAVSLGGRAVELFVRDDLAFVFTAADFFACAGAAIGFEKGEFEGLLVPDFEGSRLWIVDVADKDAPSVVTKLDFDGFVSATRRVGDVIYVAGNILPFFRDEPDHSDEGGDGGESEGDGDEGDGDEGGGEGAEDGGDGRGEGEEGGDERIGSGVFVTSINIADPQNIFVVETEMFAGTSLDIHTSVEALYVVGPDPRLLDTTLVSYVDISDPAGDVVARDQFRVPGNIDDRFSVDEHEGVFRIITEEFIQQVFSQVVALYTYDVSDPDNIERLARLPIITGESLRAVRFDGPRGYAVTFLRIDPLFVLDLSDPADPRVAGELEVPGFSTHLVPLGDRLLGVGFDDTEGFRPAIALYDVEDPADPRQLDRIILGDRGSFDTSSEATVDEKALRVIEDAGLILLPFSTFDRELGQFIDALQLISLEPEALIQRGTVHHRGLVRRADLLDQRVWVLSDLAFQTVDVDDLDAPASLASLDMIDDQELLDAGLSDCADSARFRGTALDDFFFVDGFCGAFSPFFFLSMAAGLAALRFVSRRHMPGSAGQRERKR